MAGQIDFQFDTVSGTIGLLSGGTLRATCSHLAAALGGVARGAEHRRDDEARVRRRGLVRHPWTGWIERSDRLAGLGLDPIGGTPKQFADLLASETDRRSGIIRDLGLKPG